MADCEARSARRATAGRAPGLHRAFDLLEIEGHKSPGYAAGLRYGEQMSFMAAHRHPHQPHRVQRSRTTIITQVPMNSPVPSALSGTAAAAEPGPRDPAEYVFDPRRLQSKKLFDVAVERATAALRDRGGPSPASKVAYLALQPPHLGVAPW